jgi:predicted enzyme related to lactoylglutathione lyase
VRDTTTLIDPKGLLTNAPVFASFAVKDIGAAHEFYALKLGLDVREDNQMGVLEIHSPDKSHVLVYPKPDHQPANFTVLNLQVRDIDEAVDSLAAAGVKFERYDTKDMKTDAKGVVRGDTQRDGTKGPSIAWFRDPSGNIVSVLEGSKS